VNLLSRVSGGLDRGEPRLDLLRAEGPGGADLGQRALFIVVAILCGVACIVGLTAVASMRAAEIWSADVRTAMTVRVLAPADDEAATRAARAVAEVAGVTSARAMTRQRASDLLEPWLGSGELPVDIPLPRLVEVGVDPRDDGVAARIGARLSELGFTAQVDDHARWASEVRQAASLVRAVSLGAVLLFIGAVVAAIAFAARAALVARREVVDVLHLVGAEDAFIAGEVRRRFAMLGLRAGAVGAAGATVVGGALLLGASGAGIALGDAALLPLTDVWVLLGAPVAASFVAAISAHMSVAAALRDAL
jgi:cell division transport system permease protein